MGFASVLRVRRHEGDHLMSGCNLLLDTFEGNEEQVYGK